MSLLMSPWPDPFVSQLFSPPRFRALQSFGLRDNPETHLTKDVGGCKCLLDNLCDKEGSLSYDFASGFV